LDYSGALRLRHREDGEEGKPHCQKANYVVWPLLRRAWYSPAANSGTRSEEVGGDITQARAVGIVSQSAAVMPR
jgi:hypothetical protein